MPHTHGPVDGPARHRALITVLALTSAYMIAEAIAGWFTNSLALLADAGHMLTDVGGLALSVMAMSYAAKPPDTSNTYGYYRFEILASVVNAVVLFLVSFFILYEAYERFRHPPPVASGIVLVVAMVGLAVNLTGVRLLRAGATGNLNIRGAYLEVVADLISSIGVIAAAIIMWTTGWYYADPLISAGIGVFIIPRTWHLLSEGVGILLEGTPANVDLEAVRTGLASLPGVENVHDLHAWSLTSGRNAASVHLVRASSADHDALLKAAQRLLTHERRFWHVTVQVETEDCGKHETHL